VAIEYRWAEGHYDRLPALAADLVRRQVTVIVASGGGVAPQTAKAATTTIPIVFAGGCDPVKAGLVASMARPGGNVTGITFLSNALEAKRLGLLHELVPQATVIAVLRNPDNASAETASNDLNVAARSLGLQLVFANARTERDFDPAFGAFVQQGARALVVVADAFFSSRTEQLVALTERYDLPAIYNQRQFVTAGGLMIYGSNTTDAFRQVGVYTGRILKGEQARDLPVLQSTKFDLVINLKTAKALGLTISREFLLIADEMIE